jgi:hypothetical protein
MPYIGNTTSSFNVGTANINNGAVTGDKLSTPFDYDSGTLYLDNTNNRVGIGTSSPQLSCVISNSGAQGIELTGYNAALGTSLMQYYDRSALAWVDVTHRANSHRFNGPSSEWVRIDSSGRLGVGTSSPSATLHVASSGNPEVLIGGAQTPILSFVGGTSSEPVIGYGVGSLRIGTVTGAGAAGFVERVRVDTQGRLGIGTTNPGAYSGQLVVNISPSGDHLVFADDSTSSGAAAARLGCSGNNLVFKTNSGGSAATERARITADAYLRLASGTGGIQFNGDTASANALDDYEEGTWTITIATESGSGYTLGSQFNRYVKVGNLVYVSFNVEFTAEGSGTIAVFNLPFTASTNETFILNGFVTQGNNRMSLQYTNYTSSTFFPRYDNGTAYVNYWTPNTAWAPTNNFVGTGCYSVN